MAGTPGRPIGHLTVAGTGDQTTLFQLQQTKTTRFPYIRYNRSDQSRTQGFMLHHFKSNAFPTMACVFTDKWVVLRPELIKSYAKNRQGTLVDDTC